jgi:hypothetical protein
MLGRIHSLFQQTNIFARTVAPIVALITHELGSLSDHTSQAGVKDQAVETSRESRKFRLYKIAALTIINDLSTSSTNLDAIRPQNNARPSGGHSFNQRVAERFVRGRQNKNVCRSKKFLDPIGLTYESHISRNL